jgi:hypothetical protein
LIHAELREISPDLETITYPTTEQTVKTQSTQRNPRHKTRAVMQEEVTSHKFKNLLSVVNIAVNSVNQELREFPLSTFEDRDYLSDLDTMDKYTPISLLVDMVQTSPDPNIRIKTLEQLADTYEEFPLARLGEALNDPDMLVIEEALDIIRKLKIEELVTAVTMAVKDDNPDVRLAALEIFETLQEFEPIDNIAEYPPSKFLAEMALTDPQPKFRMIALDLLAEEGQEVALKPLNQALNDPDPRVSELALDLIIEFEEKWQG